MTASLQLNLLGTLELTFADPPLPGLRSQKAIALLVYLACNPGPQRREFLADLLWNASSTAQSLSNLRTLLSRMRSHAENYLHITPETVALAPNLHIRLDVAMLEEGMADRSGTLSRDNALRLEDHLRMYRGDFLAGFMLANAPGFERWVIVERERLRFVTIQGYRRLADHWAQQQNQSAVIRAAQAWLAVDPLDEDAHLQMMRALARDGQRAAALAHYEQCRRMLAEELDVLPSEPFESLYIQIREGDSSGTSVALDSRMRKSSHNLPERLTSFVGRDTEMALLRSLLTTPATSLVTLVGEGGVGKSSLALAVGEAAWERWDDGVCFVTLSTVEAHPRATLRHRLASAIALALDFSFATSPRAAEPAEQLLAFLHRRSLLLILDNFEHLADQTPFVHQLLQAAPGCRVLITAREPLLLAEESVVRLDGLPVPPDSYAGFALFTDRARQKQHTFSLTGTNRSALTRLCQLVAGNALALELAAAWVEHFTLEEMTARLEEEMLDFLHSPLPDAEDRHRSLRQVMETSWRMLAPVTRQLLARLSIFRGAFDREAALEISEGPLEGLIHLVNASLVQQRGAGRYELHEMVRQFAGERLRAEPDAQQEVLRRHAHYYLSLVGRVERTPQMIDAVSQELANVRQAWLWAVAHSDVTALAGACAGLWNFYLQTGLFQEAEEAFGSGIEAVLALPEGTAGRRRALASLRVAQAVFLNIRTRYPEAIAVAEEAIGYGLQEENEAIIARGYLQWGTALYRQGRYEEAMTRLRMALMAAQDGGLPEDEADVLRLLGTTRLEQGKMDEARDYCQTALSIYRRRSNQLGEGNALTDLGWISQRQQRFAEAQSYLEAAERIHKAIHNQHGVTIALLNLGIVNQMQGDLSAALRVYRQLFDGLGDVPDRYHHSLINHSTGVLLTRLGDYPTARRHLLTALEIDRATGDTGGLAWSYNALGLLHNHLGDARTGLAYHREALAIGQEQGASTVEGIALLGIGQDLQALGQWQAASEAYTDAIAVQERLDQLVRAVESRSGLARCRMALEEAEAALAQVERVLDFVATTGLSGAAQPALIYWNCYGVLRAVEDERAASVLADAYALIHRQAEAITDQRLRRTYLTKLPPHPDLLAEVNALRLMPAFGLLGKEP